MKKVVILTAALFLMSVAGPALADSSIFGIVQSWWSYTTWTDEVDDGEDYDDATQTGFGIRRARVGWKYSDGGDFAATAAYILRPRAPLSWLDPGVFGTLGVGGGFAAGAGLCRPDGEIWILYGDGSAGYSLAEFETFVRHGIPVIAVVGNDAGWTQIARDQITYLGDDVATVLTSADYHRVAEGYGARGFKLERPEDIPAVLTAAREQAAAGNPVLINAIIGSTDFRKGSISM